MLLAVFVHSLTSESAFYSSAESSICTLPSIKLSEERHKLLRTGWSTTSMASQFGVLMPNQPGPYWHLEAPFVDIIGLFRIRRQKMQQWFQESVYSRTRYADQMRSRDVQCGPRRIALGMF